MAREFEDDISQVLRASSPPVTAAPFSVSTWIQGLGDSSSGDGGVFWYLGATATEFSWSLRRMDSADQMLFIAFDGAAEALFGPTMTNGQWYHVLVVERSTTDREMYVDGVSVDTNSGAVSPPAAVRFSLGRMDTAAPNRGLNGIVSHTAVWGTDVSAYAQSLAAGINPRQIRPNALFYSPLNGQSPELDILGGLDMTVFGSPPVVEEPPIPNSIVAPG